VRFYYKRNAANSLPLYIIKQMHTWSEQILELKMKLAVRCAVSGCWPSSLHSWLQRAPILSNGLPFSPLKLPPLHRGIWTSYNTWFFAPIRVHSPNGISIGSAVSAGSRSWQTDRQTDRPRYFVCACVVLRCGLINKSKSQNVVAALDRFLNLTSGISESRCV